MNADHLLSPLPSPTDRPGTSIIIYDGECRFCRRQVERLARWDRRQTLSFLSLHDDEVRERFPELSHEDLMKHLYLIDADGTSYVGAEAFVVLESTYTEALAFMPRAEHPWYGSDLAVVLSANRPTSLRAGERRV